MRGLDRAIHAVRRSIRNPHAYSRTPTDKMDAIIGAAVITPIVAANPDAWAGAAGAYTAVVYADAICTGTAQATSRIKICVAVLAAILILHRYLAWTAFLIGAIAMTVCP